MASTGTTPSATRTGATALAAPGHAAPERRLASNSDASFARLRRTARGVIASHRPRENTDLCACGERWPCEQVTLAFAEQSW